MLVRLILSSVFLLVAFFSRGQTQLVLLNREHILIRYEYGDDIRFKLKTSKQYTNGAMLGATEFGVILFNDTVPFASIERISLKTHPQKSPLNLLSKFLITAGIAYFTIDQFNNVVVQGNSFDMEPSVWKPSLILVASGVALKLLKKRSIRLRHPARLVAAPYGSRFYKSDE